MLDSWKMLIRFACTLCTPPAVLQIETGSGVLLVECTMSEISHKLTEEELGDLAVSDSTVYESNALESDTAIITQVSRGSWIFSPV